MREDIPHPDKRTSLRVVLESNPVHSRRFSRSRKGIRFALPLHSQALRGMVWDWRSFHSLVPKVASFGVSHKEERGHKNTHKAAGVGNKLRHQKTSAADVTKGWHIHLLVIYYVCWRAMRFLYVTFEDYLPLFAPPRSAGFYEFPRQSSPMFSLAALQHRLPKGNNVTEGWHPPPSVI